MDIIALNQRYITKSLTTSYMCRRQRAAILEPDDELKRFGLDLLSENWTPEQISGWLKRGIEIGLRAISPETIYAFIFRSGQKAEKLWKYLTRRKASRGRRARRSKGKITEKVQISERVEAADTRVEPGHWESDLVMCKANRPLLVLHECKMRLTVMTRHTCKSAAETASAIADILTRLEVMTRVGPIAVKVPRFHDQ